jgi:tungstate transport system permease protein
MPDNVSALDLVLSADPALLAILRLSLLVSLSAAAFGALIGVPFGAGVALTRFPGREAVIVILNALMGLPPVVVGLVVYLLLSRSGPLGSLGLLFTPQAMIIAQTVLIAPIIAALARQTIDDLWSEYRDELAAMDVGPLARIATLIWDGRFSLVTALLAGFGRAAAEVGAVIIVGGNIDGFTRTMTTAIALETSKGDLPLAIGLGLVLIAIVVAVNAAAWGLRRAGERLAG